MENLRKLLHLSCAAVLLLAVQAKADVDIMATEKYVDDSVADATNATYKAAVSLTQDATNALAQATLPNDFHSLTNNPAFTNAVAHVSPKVDVVAPTNRSDYAGKAADAQLTGIELTKRYTKDEIDSKLAGKRDLDDFNIGPTESGNFGILVWKIRTQSFNLDLAWNDTTQDWRAEYTGEYPHVVGTFENGVYSFVFHDRTTGGFRSDTWHGFENQQVVIRNGQTVLDSGTANADFDSLAKVSQLPKDYASVSNAAMNAVTKVEIVDNLSSTDSRKPLSANMGRALKDSIDAIKARGRYLSVWDCTTGRAKTQPETSPYRYNTGDYFIVGTVGTTNYRPSGTQYDITVPSRVVETNDVKVNDTYYFDGTSWTLILAPDFKLPQKWALANVTNRSGQVAEDLVALSVKSNAQGAVSLGKGEATGINSVAVGNGKADATGAFAVGNSTIAHGQYSFAEGVGTIANGRYSHASGVNASAQNEGEWVWSGSHTNSPRARYEGHGAGTFTIYPREGRAGFWLGDEQMTNVVAEIAAGLDETHKTKRLYDADGNGYINGDGEVWGSGDIVTWVDAEEPTWVYEPVQGQKDVWKFQNIYLWYDELQQWFCLSPDIHDPNPYHTGIVSKDAPTLSFDGGAIVLNRHTEAGGIVKKDTLAKTGDLAGYVPTTRKINGQTLTQDITIQGMPTTGLVWNATAGNVKTANGEKEIGAAEVGAYAVREGVSISDNNIKVSSSGFKYDIELYDGVRMEDYNGNRIHYRSDGVTFNEHQMYFPERQGYFAVDDWSSLRTMLTDANSNTNADCECIRTNIVNLVKTSKCFSNAVTEAVAGYSAVSNAAMNAVTKDKIVDDLSSHDSSKPLSANMGRALKDSIENTAAQKQDKLPYPTNAIPTRLLSGTIPLSSVKNASGQSVGASDVGAYSQQSGAALENIVAQKQTQLNATQLEAVNSGITATKVGTYDGYASGKQDKLPYPTNAIPLALVKNASGQAVGAADVGAYAQQSGAALEESVSYVQSSVSDLFAETSALWDSLSGKINSEDGYATNTKFDGEIYFGYNSSYCNIYFGYYDPYTTYVYLPPIENVYSYSYWGGQEPLSYIINNAARDCIYSSGCLLDGSSVNYGLYFGYGSDLYLEGGWDSVFNYQTYTTLGMVLGEMDQTVNDHVYDNNNPHNITAEQIGAIGSSYISTNNPAFVAQVLATGMQLDPTAIAEFNEACRRGTLESNIVAHVRKYFNDTTAAHYYWDPVLCRTWQIAVSNGCFFGEIVDNDIPHE